MPNHQTGAGMKALTTQYCVFGYRACSAPRSSRLPGKDTVAALRAIQPVRELSCLQAAVHLKLMFQVSYGLALVMSSEKRYA